MASAPPPNSSPAPRLASLDALRGFAVIGIAFMNVAAFAMPFAAYDDPRAWGGRSAADLAAWAFDFVLIDGKMRALFSALFGASMLLVIDRADASGRSGLVTHLRRMAWLLVIGLVHGLLIWFGDILVLYAVCGTLMLAARRRPVHELVVAAGLLMLLPIAGGALAWAAGAAAGWDRAELHQDLLLHLGSYPAILGNRAATQAGLLGDQLASAGFETLGLMAAGMAGLRSGFLTGAWERARYARAAAGAYLIGLPPMLAMAAALLATGFEPHLLVGANAAVGALCRPVLAFAHAALLLWWLATGGSWLKSRLAAAGRMALTNYLATSVAGTALCYGYGGALFGRLSRAEQFGLAAAMGLLILLWSAPWLHRFRYGPVEWLWRSLARGRLQPMRW